MAREPDQLWARGWRCGPRTFPLGQRTLVMGILNATPDSFSGDGLGTDIEAIVAYAGQMVADGADLLDVGGESTRPGSQPISVEEELARVIPVVERLVAAFSVPISVDTSKPEVAEAALRAGAHMLNDVTGLQGHPAMARIAARWQVPVVAMHMKGRPWNMQDNPTYRCLMGEIATYLERSIAIALEAGVARENVILDPGIGFGKTLQHNLEILRRLGELKALGQPLLIGTSRKGFIGKVLGLPTNDRVEGTAATVAIAIAHGADIVRVHDVKPIVRVARMTDAIVRRRSTDAIVYLGLGSNLGDRKAAIGRALGLMADWGLTVLRASSLYETEPIGYAQQGWFLNGVAEVATTLPPVPLLAALQSIERELGRQEGPRWGPRPIDLDILLYDDVRMQTTELTIPHPRMHERAFVLVPLRELLPDYRAADGTTIHQLLARLGDSQAVRRLSEPQHKQEGEADICPTR